MNVLVTDQRIVRGVPSTLTWQYVDEFGAAAAPPGTVTIGVTKADGTVVVAAGTATTGSGSNPRTYTLPASSTLELLTATWTTGGLTFTTLIDVAGAFYFTIAEARTIEPSLADTTKYPDADVVRVRHEVEDELEYICDAAFVPRYRRITIDGSGTCDLTLEDNQLRNVRTVRVYSTATAYTTFSAAELADLVLDDDLTIHRPAGLVFDDSRRGNLVVEYEYGYDRPPTDLKRAAVRRLRSRLNISKSGIPDRATSFTLTDGGTYNLELPDAYKTGIPDVDAVYARYSRRAGDKGAVPASASIDFDPQRFSIFHGPRR